jgi:hypothetical protein
MSNNLLKVSIIISLLNIVFTFFSIKTIEKHSIHPVYGSYQQKIFGCEPWDSCHHSKQTK